MYKINFVTLGDPRLGPSSGQNCFTRVKKCFTNVRAALRTRVKHFFNPREAILSTSGPNLGSTRVQNRYFILFGSILTPGA